MPASNIDSYLQDARKNFDAVRPAPIYADANQSTSHYENRHHVSTNCYYGYHDLKSVANNHVDTDCEMVELEAVQEIQDNRTPSNGISKKRCAEEPDYPQTKRLREDDSSMCSLVGTRSSPSHSASAFNVNIPTVYTMYLRVTLVFRLHII